MTEEAEITKEYINEAFKKNQKQQSIQTRKHKTEAAAEIWR